MEHHHHHIDDESNEVVSTLVSEIVDDEESHLKVVNQYQITDHGDDSDDGMNCDALSDFRSRNNSSNASDVPGQEVNAFQHPDFSKRIIPLRIGPGHNNYRQKYKKVWELLPEFKGKG